MKEEKKEETKRPGEENGKKKLSLKGKSAFF